MTATGTSKLKEGPEISVLCRPIADTSPMPMAGVEGPSHAVCYVNPAFCRLTGKNEEELIGKAFSAAAPVGSECLALLDRVDPTGKAENQTGEEYPGAIGFTGLISLRYGSGRRMDGGDTAATEN